MERPIILEGRPFDWEEGSRMQDHVADAAAEGQVNWYAAAGADPGCMKCPGCEEVLWHEGTKVQCPHCSHVWEPKR